jgi:hypothetical protein
VPGACDASRDSASYLSSVVTCAASQCKADIWATTLVLGPLELICRAMGNSLPRDNIDAAYAAASDTSQSTRKPVATSKYANHKTSKASYPGTDLTTTLKSTLTRTTTDSSGNTLLVIVPIEIGPSGVFTGDLSTSTLSATSTNAPSSIPASPSPSAAASSPTATRPSQSSAGAQRTDSPASGNGSPFENMQASASKWSVSGPLLGMGALAMLFMRL